VIGAQGTSISVWLAWLNVYFHWGFHMSEIILDAPTLTETTRACP
jgi:hypothetical protein